LVWKSWLTVAIPAIVTVEADNFIPSNYGTLVRSTQYRKPEPRKIRSTTRRNWKGLKSSPKSVVKLRMVVAG
jgi:hypothetical protein